MKISVNLIQEKLSDRQKDLELLTPIRISVLRNIMLEPIEPFLRCYAMTEVAANAVVRFGGYDTVFQEAVGGCPELLSPETDFVFVFMKLESFSPALAFEFLSLDGDAFETEKQRILGHVEAILQGIRQQTMAAVLWHGFELPQSPAYGIFDTRAAHGHRAIVCGLNEALGHILQRFENAYYVDMELCVSRIGGEHFYDQRYWHLGRAPYTLAALNEIAHEDFKFVRSLKGRTKKCLVLDCDNTLWGGVIGEDGLSGIRLSKTHPGSPYYEFQQEVLNLNRRGVILAICSKNNEADVWEVFDKHPDMLLRREHIGAAQISWQDKVLGLRQIAADLNIGLDSLVLVDDSEFEIHLVRDQLPEVDVLPFPAKNPATARGILASCGWFEAVSLSEEDLRRGGMYRMEAQRKAMQAVATDMESYYASLEMIAHFGLVDDFSLPRAAQLTQRTNQFNLTTRRYSEADIRSYMDVTDVDVMQIRIEDRFGDYGIVGVGILKYSEDTAVLDTFLLSCRALGRKVEDAFLVKCLGRALEKGAVSVIGEYRPTLKNNLASDFYVHMGFVNIRDNIDREEVRLFRYDLMQGLPAEPSCFQFADKDVASKK